MTHPGRRHDGEEGYFLLWLVVVCFLLLLALAVAAPRVAKELERDNEVESEHRAQEYVRAIQLYYNKNHNYPTSIDQLLGSGTSGVPTALNVKYLRQQYKDPLTRDDYRLIHMGEAKTEVKGFFGDPLPGIPTGTLGSAAGSQSNLTGGSNFGATAAGSAFGSSTGAAGTSSATTGATPTTAAGAPPSTAAGGSGTAATGTTPFGGTGTSATSFQGSKGGIVGVGSNAKGPGLVEWNGSENIEDWEFLYDPRVEVLKAKVSILGGGVPAAGGGSLGNGFAPAAGITTPTTAPGTFGAPSSGSTSSPAPTPPVTNPQ